MSSSGVRTDGDEEAEEEEGMTTGLKEEAMYKVWVRRNKKDDRVECRGWGISPSEIES